MTLTMIDVEATEHLDFEPGCDEPECEQPATHKLIARDPGQCPCVSLECSEHAPMAAAWLEDWAEWTCHTCGFVTAPETCGLDVWQVVPL